ncbi:MAG: ATP-binding protein [Solirubrobacterales bacterium]|nr:ATP-binding protein [Solirubrobacterales bacterium]
MAPSGRAGPGYPGKGKGTDPDPPPLELKTPSRADSVTETRRRVAEYAESGGANRDDVELAVAEAVGNAVVHAFEGHDDGVVTVRAEVDGPDHLVVEITDAGFGITTMSRDPRAGFGLPIIGALAESVEIQTGHRGTRLVLRFPRAG